MNFLPHGDDLPEIAPMPEPRNPDAQNVGLAEIAPNSNLLAVCPVGSGLIVYDIRHLPPQPCRIESTKTQVKP